MRDRTEQRRIGSRALRSKAEPAAPRAEDR